MTNDQAATCLSPSANFAIQYKRAIRRFYDRKNARTNRIVALIDVAHKLAG